MNPYSKLIKEGDTLYYVGRFEDDKKLHLCKVEITRIERSKTPKGKERRPRFYVKPVNFVYSNGDKEREENPDILNRSAVVAVEDAMEQYLRWGASHAENQTPEERLLRAICAENEPRITPSMIYSTIMNLKDYHRLLTEAYRIDDEKIQKITVEEDK